MNLRVNNRLWHERATKGSGVDGSRFDDLARALATQPTRRTLLRRIVAGASAALLASQIDDVAIAAKCREAGEICREDSNCCSGSCGAPDRRGRRTCECTPDQHFCGQTCCPRSLGCDSKGGGCCVGSGDSPIGGFCEQDGDCCSGVCNETSKRCLDTCIPNGGRTTLNLASPENEVGQCCSNIGYRPDQGPVLCAACVPDGYVRLTSVPIQSPAICCTGASVLDRCGGGS